MIGHIGLQRCDTPRLPPLFVFAVVIPKAATAWEAWSPYMVKRGAAEGAASSKETGISKWVAAVYDMLISS